MTDYIPSFSDLYPRRTKDTHKGQCGRIGILAGSSTMLGAGILTARAALRSGAGLVYLMTVPDSVQHIAIQYPELIVLPFPSDVNVLASYVETYRFDVVAIGPGLGRESGTQQFVRSILLDLKLSTDVPVVLDADGLMAIKSSTLAKCQPQSIVVTPHPKEFDHLFGKAEKKDRIERTQFAAKQTTQVVVLKGAGTVIGSEDQCYVNKTGNAGMATAGSGDVLTGMIAALIGQGLGLWEASLLGVHAHGMAGDIAFEKNNNGLIASDIVDAIPKAMGQLQP